MIDVLFRKQVHGTFAAISSKCVFLERKVMLPIPPTIGLEVCEGDWSATVTELAVIDGRVIVYDEPDKEIYNAVLHGQPHRSIEALVEEWVEEGWKRKEENDDGQ